MKLLFIQKKTNPGGSKESLLATITLLAGAGHETAVLCSEEGYLTGRLEELSIPHFRAYVPEYRKLTDRLLFRRHIRRVAAQVPEKKFDWIISNEMWWGPAAAALAEKTGSRSAAILRDTLTGPPKLRKYDLQNLDRVLCINPIMTGWVNNLSGGGNNARTIFNPVALPEPDRERCEYWKNVSETWPGVGITFLTVGSLGPRKNQVDAVRTLHLLEEECGGEAGLILAGGGGREYIAEIRKIARELALSARILMPGHVAGVRELLDTADYFLFTSRREGLPRAIIEALLAGVPAFSYPLPGLEKIYGEFHDSFVSGNPTPQSLSEKVKATMKEKGLGPKVSVLRERMKEQFSGENHLKVLLSVLQEESNGDQEIRKTAASTPETN